MTQPQPSETITPDIINLCHRAHACKEGLHYLRACPRTIAELHAYNTAWSEWLALNVPGLPEAVRDELYSLTGSRAWYRDGLRHREDGPAIECADGYREWYRDGTLHRSDYLKRTDG